MAGSIYWLDNALVDYANSTDRYAEDVADIKRLLRDTQEAFSRSKSQRWITAYNDVVRRAETVLQQEATP